MSLCQSNVLSSWSLPSRALLIQWMVPEWHVNLYALTDNLTWYWSRLLHQQSVLRGRGVTQVQVFWGQSVEPEGMTKKCVTRFFWKFFKYIKENLGSNFTLEVFIFRKTEHRQPIKICVHWGIPVSWHDNLLFKCTAAFLPYTTEQSRQLIHYHWAPFFSLPPTTFPPFCSPRPLYVAAPLWKPFCVLLLNLQTGLDKEQQCRSESVRSSSCEGGEGIKEADIWRCYRWWINPKKYSRCNDAHVDSLFHEH